MIIAMGSTGEPPISCELRKGCFSGQSSTSQATVGKGEAGAPEIPADAGTVLDLGHARTILRVAGPEAAALMTRLAPLDVRPGAFPDGTVATSAIHHVAVTILARDAGFELHCFRSFGLALFEHVAEVAEQFGLEIV